MQRLERVGRYRIEVEVARGGMGVVYRARTPEGAPVALKLLLAGQGASPIQRRRMATEVQTLLRLRHPHLVGLLDAGEHRGELRAEGAAASAAKPGERGELRAEGAAASAAKPGERGEPRAEGAAASAAKPGEHGAPYLVMEWVQGETLAARLARGLLAPREACELVQRLAGALEHCHAQGVLHRDLKPDNVLLRSSDGAPLLTDFGLSKDEAGEELTAVVRTVAGRWLGTPGWWPPEQARGELARIGPRSDVYGLGAILYAALTGVPPQAGRTLQEQLQALDRPPVPPAQRRPELPAWLDAVCLRALALDPEQRQASPGELARELESGLAGRLPLPGTRELAARSSPPRPLLVVALLALAVAGVAGLATLDRGSSPGPVASAPGIDAPPSPVQPTPPAPPLQPPGPAPADTRAEVARLLSSADAHGKRGDLPGSLADCDRALELDPQNARAHAHRGAVRQRLDDLAGARADLDRALELDPQHAVAHGNRGLVRMLQGDLPGALADYDRALELDPRHPEVHYCRGLLRLQQGDLTSSRQDLDRALELNPQHAKAWCTRGVVRHQQGDAAGALEDLDQALARDPGLAQAYRSRGVVRRDRGDLTGALADWERCLELAPQDAQAPAIRTALKEARAQLPPR